VFARRGLRRLSQRNDSIGFCEEKKMTETNEQTRQGAVCDLPSGCEKRRSVLRTVEIVLLVLGIVGVAIYASARIESYITSRFVVANFEKLAAIASKPAAEELVAEDGLPAEEPDFRDWGEGRIRAFQEPTKKSLDAPLAILTIPSVRVKAPVFDGTDALTLNHAVGRIAGTALPGEEGNIGIAGHRDGFFRGLKDIKQGDEIDLKTRNGTDVYTVDSIRIVGPRDVRVLRMQERPAVTLVTCYPFYFAGSAPKRFVVTAFLTQHNPAGQTATEARLNPQLNSTTQEEQ
jgi:sortase A